MVAIPHYLQDYHIVIIYFLVYLYIILYIHIYIYIYTHPHTHIYIYISLYISSTTHVSTPVFLVSCLNKLWYNEIKKLKFFSQSAYPRRLLAMGAWNTKTWISQVWKELAAISTKPYILSNKIYLSCLQ